MSGKAGGLLRVIALLALAAGAGALAHAASDAWTPTRPIRFLVPYPPGAGTDTTARVLAQKVGERWGQQVIVDNRSGAGGVIAVESTVNANPDGYTILLVSNSQAVTAASGLKLPYDITRDLKAVTQATSLFYVIYVPLSVPAKSIKEFIAYAKANPGKLNYGSSGAASLQRLGAELFNQQAGVKLVHVPYKGSAAIIAGMLANEIHFGMNSLFSVRPMVQAGRLRWLAVTAARRSPVVDLPTVAEAGGLPGYEVDQWYGITAPARTPAPVVSALHAAFADALKQPDVASRLTGDGSVLVGSTPQEFDAFVRSEIAKWGRLIRNAKIAIE